jgi:enediyne biosynthesis protein E4
LLAQVLRVIASPVHSFPESALPVNSTEHEQDPIRPQSGAGFFKMAIGIAIGNFQGDGSVDVLVSDSDSAPLPLRNKPEGKGIGWARVWSGKSANLDAAGARFTYQAGDLLPGRMKVGDGGSWPVRDPRPVLGIGTGKTRAGWW